MQTILILVALGSALAQADSSDKPAAPKELPPRVQKARADWQVEGDTLFTAYWRKLRQVKDKHRKLFEKGSTESTKRGDLESAKAWQALGQVLKPELKNIATRETIRVSRELKAYGGAQALTDGKGAAPSWSQKDYWWGGSQDGPFWVRCALPARHAIRQVRWCIPQGTAWHSDGNEPLDYEILLLTAGRAREATSVRNGRHPRKEVSQDGKSCWVTLDLRELVAATEIELRFKKSSGRSDWSPVLFELQVLEEPQDPGKLPSEAKKGSEAERAWNDYVEEASAAWKDAERGLRAARERHRQEVEREKAEASRKGDLPLTLAWEDLAKELRPRLENVAPAAKLSVSGSSRSHGQPEVLLDGTGRAGFNQPTSFWYGGVPPQKPDWVRLELSSTESISAIRFAAPVGTSWHPDGHEPLDYDVLLRKGRAVVQTISVRDGKHPKTERSEDGTTQWVTMEIAGSPEASEVEIHVSRTSGLGKAPVLFEVEVLASR